jgi:hypothetical protein
VKRLLIVLVLAGTFGTSGAVALAAGGPTIPEKVLGAASVVAASRSWCW